MARDCVHLTFVGLHDNSFYFDDFAHDEVDTDAFELSMEQRHLIRCPKNKFLILNGVNEFDLRDLTIREQNLPEYTFYVTIYKDLSEQKKRGRAVMLYALKGDTKYAAVCNNDSEVCAEKIELQEQIQDAQHKALFYMDWGEQPNGFKFRSSMYPNKVLGFDETDMNKLILRPSDPESQQDIITLLEK